jgi:two-component system, sensor histidine kinase and response regulator
MDNSIEHILNFNDPNNPMGNTKVKLLFIDDEEHNLESLKASFRREWDIHTASNAIEADKILKNEEITVIMSDYKMPIKSGIDLMEEYVERYPDVSRIMITAFADMPMMTDAINRGKIHYFLQKPWTANAVRQAVVSSHRLYELNRELKVKNHLLTKAYDDLSKFVYSASHEMRSPLMFMLGLIDLTRNEKNKTAFNEYLDLMAGSVKELDNFVQGIVDYYNLSRMEVRPKKIDFAEIIYEIKKEKLLTDDSPLDIQMTYSLNHFNQFINDPYKLKVVFENLISHAIKPKEDMQEGHKNSFLVNVTPYELTITVTDKNAPALFHFIESAFKYFFTSSKSAKITFEGELINLFLFKDALLKLRGHITMDRSKSKEIHYVIHIPSM